MKLIILNLILLAIAVPSLRGQAVSTLESCLYTLLGSYYALAGPDGTASQMQRPRGAVSAAPFIFPLDMKTPALTANVDLIHNY